ncbi:ABC transporter permease subunit [Nocardioides sp. AE5]|uniref:ABC transporter permease subunit n=1 Tax=Nocardioides sp. AE5 TaxID=2962573 RepID=UPI002880E548|nr:carboxypeptidase regulatory-like domain-containing protein [Nocardioides sp. AE5]MDT0201304.1 carboxypeptidase regulatory-like domain-containing protein [Nocardioides sp. AE5]
MLLGAMALVAGIATTLPAHAAEETLTGSVVNINGAAVPEVPVAVTSEDGSFSTEAVTDAQGIFTVTTPGPGTYVATVDPDNVPPGVMVPERASEGISVTLPTESILEIQLRLTEAISGTILNQVGDAKDPVAGVPIVVESSDGSFNETATSDEEGEWTVFLPGPGQYKVYVDTENLPEGVFVREGYSSEVNVAINSGVQRTVLFPMGEDNRRVLGTFDKALQLTVEGIRFGLLLALAALGLSLIFGTTGLVNFAHGEMITIGAVVAWSLNVAGLHLLLAAVVAVIACALLGGAQEVGLWKPLRRRKTGLISMMIITIGMSIFLRFAIQFLIGGENKTYKNYVVQEGINFGPVSLAPRDLWSMALALIILVLAGLFVVRSRMGKAMRAVSDNPALASASGIDVNRVILFVWVFGGAMAGLAGVLLGLSQQVKFEMGFNLLLLIFAGVILGGLGTAFGALVGSLVVGLFVTLSTLWIPPELKYIPAFAVLILILLVRPQGILGRSERVG